MNVETTTTSNDGGHYLLQLPGGTYGIRVGNPGFQTTVEQSVPVYGGSNLTVNFHYPEGLPEQKVEVHVETRIINSDSSTGQTTAENFGNSRCLSGQLRSSGVIQFSNVLNTTHLSALITDLNSLSFGTITVADSTLSESSTTYF